GAGGRRSAGRLGRGAGTRPPRDHLFNSVGDRVDAAQRWRRGCQYRVDLRLVARSQYAWRTPWIRRGKSRGDTHDDAARVVGKNGWDSRELPGAWMDRDRWPEAVLGVAHTIRTCRTRRTVAAVDHRPSGRRCRAACRRHLTGGPSARVVV